VAERDRVLAYYRRILSFYEKESVARAHLAFWTELARRWRPRRVLEIGSGLGRITCALERHAPAVGVDISLEMLGRACRSRIHRGQPFFVAADMRTAVFRNTFDLIVAPSDPFSHLILAADRRKALRMVAGQLSECGRFVLEALYRRPRVTSSVQRRLSYDGGELAIHETWRPLAKKSLWRARFAYCDRPTRGSPRRLAASFTARCWDANKIRTLFASCGLAVCELWGSWDQTPFTPDASHLIVVAEKRRGRTRSQIGRKTRTRR
jgi:SAM-dependent methyltransferase